MANFTLRDVIDSLNGGWATYIPRFRALSPEAQAGFLASQGFKQFRDLVAHVIVWWEEGHRAICGILDDPGYSWQQVDVDAFNAEAVRRFGLLPEDEVFDYYERMRRVMLDLVADLPEDALANEDIAAWLLGDVIEHLAEHDIPAA